jgi:hypothetical protein
VDHDAFARLPGGQLEADEIAQRKRPFHDITLLGENSVGGKPRSVHAGRILPGGAILSGSI